MSSDSGWSRRDLLKTFLGAPLALLAGCDSNKAPPPLPPGEIVGASDVVGHRIRDGFRPAIAPNAWQSKEVVIVGGGIAGLTAAWRLKRAGVENFVLLELEPAAGGTARYGQSPSGAYPSFPWGAHYIPAPRKENTALLTLLDEMGVLVGRDESGEPVVAEQFLCRDPQERVFYKGRWYEGLYLRAGASGDDLRQWESFKREIDRWVAWRDGRGRRAFDIPVASGSDDAEVRALDKLSMADFLDRGGYTSPRLRWYAEYACRDDYGASLQDTSAWAGLFYFASRVPAPGRETQPLITFVAHLLGQVGEHVRSGAAVCELNPVAGGIEVTAFDAKSNEALGYRANRVIFAAPQFLARHLIRPWRENPPAHLREFEYGAWFVANLFLKDRPASSPAGFPLCWDNVLYESPSLGYVVATHQTENERGPTVFTYYYPLCDADPRQARARLLGLERGACAELALADLNAAHPEIRTLTERLDVMRWGHAMIRPRPGFIWSTARAKAAEPFGKIHFANTDLSGVALFEEAFYHGNRAADEILSARV
jgi:glycine/D-amino acid oxidase-like deaminating enzyme